MKRLLTVFAFCLLFSIVADAQIGRRFPSERKIVKDPKTGVMLTFLTSAPGGDSKIYQTHNQWTSDGQWLIFRSGRVRGEALAVNEKTGDKYADKELEKSYPTAEPTTEVIASTAKRSGHPITRSRDKAGA